MSTARRIASQRPGSGRALPAPSSGALGSAAAKVTLRPATEATVASHQPPHTRKLPGRKGLPAPIDENLLCVPMDRDLRASLQHYAQQRGWGTDAKALTAVGEIWLRAASVQIALFQPAR